VLVSSIGTGPKREKLGKKVNTAHSRAEHAREAKKKKKRMTSSFVSISHPRGRKRHSREDDDRGKKHKNELGMAWVTKKKKKREDSRPTGRRRINKEHTRERRNPRCICWAIKLTRSPGGMGVRRQRKR